MGRKQAKRAAFAYRQKRIRQRGNGCYLSKVDALKIAARRLALYVDGTLYEAVKAEWNP